MDPIVRAARAQQLLDDPLLQEAFAEIEKAVTEALAGANLSDLAALQRHTAALQAVRNLRQQFQSVVTTGAQASISRPGVA